MLNAVDNLFRQTATVQRADLAPASRAAGADRVANFRQEGCAQRTTRDNRHCAPDRVPAPGDRHRVAPS